MRERERERERQREREREKKEERERGAMHSILPSPISLTLFLLRESLRGTAITDSDARAYALE